MGKAKNGNGDEIPAATPSKLHRIFRRVHSTKDIERTIADTAKGRRIKAKQRKEEEDE